jgi:hypothetical protein
VDRAAVFSQPCGDFHCGLRGFRREAIMALGLQQPGMEFASEMVVKATLAKLRITEVPTTLSPDGRSRPPHLRSWRDGWRNLRFLLLFSPVWLFFYPGLALLLLGVAGMAWLCRHALRLWDRLRRQHFGLHRCRPSSAAFQAIVFYMFAKTYAIRSGLLPPDPLVARLRQVCCALRSASWGSRAVVVIGVVLAVLAVGNWEIRGFGHLDPQQSLRIVVPSTTLLILGLQIMFSSCLLSILQLESKVRRCRGAARFAEQSRTEHGTGVR